VATVALMTGKYRLSRRSAQSVLFEHFGISASLGSIIAMERRASAALQPVHNEIHAMVKAAAVKYTDGTTWTRCGRLKSVTVLATETLSAFFITEDGTRETIERLFDVDTGIVVSDRASIFCFWSMCQRQICWSHLIRKFVYFSERDGPAAQHGRDLLTLASLVFDYWHAFLDGKFDREELAMWMKPLRAAFCEELERAVAADIERLSGSCANLLAHAKAMWTFVEHEGVHPTNNESERDLRGFVIWRKICHGSQSIAGDRFAERVMSVVQTARKLRRSARDIVLACVKAKDSGLPVPSMFSV
jgi:hypothetical protein